MDLIKKVTDAFDKITNKQPAIPPIIMSPYGPVSESARRQAAYNMRDDYALRLRVEQLIADQFFAGNLEKGIIEARRRYPEAFQDDDKS
jgi:hypothetical protein